MKAIRKLLVKFLGFEGYIRLVSKIYLQLVGAGLLAKNYPELFFLKKIIRPGFYCLDIGANLGYYSTFLSKLAGPQGKVLAVEPVPMFQEIWRDNVKASGVSNLELLPYALGGENTRIQMGTPERDGLLHHGMTKVTSSADEKYARTYDVEMKVPDELFRNLNRLDFVKCDVEGFEYQVFSHLQETLQKFKPLIQTELNGTENREGVITLLQNLGYQPYILSATQTLVHCADAQKLAHHHGDFYFKHSLAA
ncbi:MAG: FkbM family methyltransferase [Bacteroidota bacterium]|nr:FkbM family methyltransferase [Bacteroidota bacterium]